MSQVVGAIACVGALMPAWAQNSYWVDGNGRVYDSSGNAVPQQSAAQHEADLKEAAQQPKKRVWITSNDRKAAGFHAKAAQQTLELQGKGRQHTKQGGNK